MPARKVFAHSKSLLRLSAVLALSLSAVQPSASAKPHPASWVVHRQPQKLVNGSPALFEVTSPAPLESLQGSWLGHEVVFSPGSSSSPSSRTRWFALAGVDLETKPGKYPLALTGLSHGRTLAFESRFSIAKARYKTVTISVPKKFTEPSPDELQDIARSKEIKTKAFHHVEPQRLWDGPFRAPAQARISDVFGVHRVTNGVVQSIHQGLDYAVPAGTVVTALNRGTVLLAQPLYYEGNFIVIDHGQGLMTLYLHLSEFKVKQGDSVEAGQVIALSGGTGQATGPHLHLAVRWQGIYLNPATLLGLRMP